MPVWIYDEFGNRERDKFEPTLADEMKILKWKETKDEPATEIPSKLRQENADPQPEAR